MSKVNASSYEATGRYDEMTRALRALSCYMLALTAIYFVPMILGNDAVRRAFGHAWLVFMYALVLPIIYSYTRFGWMLLGFALAICTLSGIGTLFYWLKPTTWIVRIAKHRSDDADPSIS